MADSHFSKASPTQRRQLIGTVWTWNTQPASSLKRRQLHRPRCDVNESDQSTSTPDCIKQTILFNKLSEQQRPRMRFQHPVTCVNFPLNHSRNNTRSFRLHSFIHSITLDTRPHSIRGHKKKQFNGLMSQKNSIVTSSNSDRFSNYFTMIFNGKFVTKSH